MHTTANNAERDTCAAPLLKKIQIFSKRISLAVFLITNLHASAAEEIEPIWTQWYANPDLFFQLGDPENLRIGIDGHFDSKWSLRTLIQGQNRASGRKSFGGEMTLGYSWSGQKKERSSLEAILTPLLHAWVATKAFAGIGFISFQNFYNLEVTTPYDTYQTSAKVTLNHLYASLGFEGIWWKNINWSISSGASVRIPLWLDGTFAPNFDKLDTGAKNNILIDSEYVSQREDAHKQALQGVGAHQPVFSLLNITYRWNQ